MVRYKQQVQLLVICWLNSHEKVLRMCVFMYVKSVVSTSGKIDFVMIAIYVNDMIFLSNKRRDVKERKGYGKTIPN